jgi:hypothetical protein
MMPSCRLFFNSSACCAWFRAIQVPNPCRSGLAPKVKACQTCAKTSQKPEAYLLLHRIRQRRALLLTICSVVALTLLPAVRKSDTDFSTNTPKSLETVKKKSDIGLRNSSVIVAPIPVSNPAIGAGLTLGAGYLFTLPREQYLAGAFGGCHPIGPPARPRP